MAQVEQPANLARQDNPAYRLITLILIRCGLRISDALGLAFDCIVTDADGAPYLLYYNPKMKREALVPVDDELLALIGGRSSGCCSASQPEPRCCSPARTATSTGSGPSPAAPTAGRSTAGWKTATSATSTGSRCT